MEKSSNILLRISDEDHKTIKIKSALFGKSKSNFIRDAALSYIKNKNDFQKLLKAYHESEEHKSCIIDIIFRHYRDVGFPFYTPSDEEKKKKMLSLSRSSSPLLDNDLLQSNYVGMSLASSFHNHMLEVEYGNSRRISPMEAFLNDEKFRDCIKRALDLDIVPDNVGMRKILKTRNGVRSVCNFKPVIAKFFYDTYVPVSGNVIDPCAGFSGRLCGAISSNKNINYIGIDPDSKTIKSGLECSSFFKNDYSFKAGFHLGCAENVMPSLRSDYYDLVFTSPPYFSVEEYSNDKDQSYIKFPIYQNWLNGFLYKIVDESYRVLKTGSRLIINIKNYEKFKIADDFLLYSQKIGFVLEKTYNMKLANNEFNRKKGQVNHHTEPVFVLKKV